MLVMREGRIAMAVEGRGRRITIASWMTEPDVEIATINGAHSAATQWTEALLKAGCRRETDGLRSSSRFARGLLRPSAVPRARHSQPRYYRISSLPNAARTASRIATTAEEVEAGESSRT